MKDPPNDTYENRPYENGNGGGAIAAKIEQHVVKGTMSPFRKDGELEDLRQSRHRKAHDEAYGKGKELAFRSFGEPSVIGECCEDAEYEECAEMPERLSHPVRKVFKTVAERKPDDRQLKALLRRLPVVRGGRGDRNRAFLDPFHGTVLSDLDDGRVGRGERHVQHRRVFLQRCGEGGGGGDLHAVSRFRLCQAARFQGDRLGKHFLDGNFYAVRHVVGARFDHDVRLTCFEEGDRSVLADGGDLRV